MENNQSIGSNLDTRLLKPDQVADRLNISKSYAYRLIQTGAIPVVRIGTACRVRPQDLEEYIYRNLQNQVNSF